MRDEQTLREIISRSVSTDHLLQVPRTQLPIARVGERLTKVERHGGGSLIAATAAEVIVAHAMYVPAEGGREAEVGILVEDGWQSKGVGKLLLSKLAEDAVSGGVETFTAEVLGENLRVLRLFAEVFPGTRHTIRYGVYNLRAPLRKPAGPTVLAQRVRRVA